MSLVVTVYVPSGIVMGADSRMTLNRTEEREEAGQKVRLQQQFVLSDSGYKVVELKTVGAGVAIYDAAMIENQPVDSHVRRFEEEALAPGDDVQAVAEKFLAYFRDNFPKVNVGFHVAGYRVQDRASVPYVIVGHTTREPEVRRLNLNEAGQVVYGVSWSGDALIANRLIDREHLPIFAAMPLQDAVDYVIHLIRTTIDTMRFEPRFPSVGGPIDVLVVRPDGMQWVQRKELAGEA